MRANAREIYAAKNVVIFTGRALVEILRDQTMQKSFMTLAYISDMMVGSEVSPLQKQQLLKIAKSYVGEGEYAAAIVATCEDQFMANEADLVANFKTRVKSADFQAVRDVTFKDFSAISYLLFKHGNQIQMRLSKAGQAFFYRSLITFLVLATYMIESGFSGAIPFTNFYYFVFMLFLAPAEILTYAIYYKDYAHDYLYRIFGHYKYNFSFTLVEPEAVILDLSCAIFDWLVVFLPFETFQYGALVSRVGSKNVSAEAVACHKVILLQVIFFFYFMKANVLVIYSVNVILLMTIIGVGMIFDDARLVGTAQFFTCPAMLFALFFQILVLCLRNVIAEVLTKLLIRKYADLLDWYQDVEDRLQFEEYEDPNQQFSIQQYPPLNHKIKSATILNTLRLINLNMMKCPKTDGIEQILDRINTVLDQTMRGDTQAVMTGTINLWTLELNDLNKETEYQDNKNAREIVYVKRQMVVFIITTLLFGAFGLILSMTLDYTNIGIYYYVALSLFSLAVYFVLPYVLNYISNILLFYTAIVIFCYTIYTSEQESLQPTGLIFVLALVAGLNHSYIYLTMLMIVISVMMNIFFAFLTDTDQQQLTAYFSTFSTMIRIFTGVVWSAYVYVQELEKKKQFVNGHRKVRSYIKLKQILNILVPAVVRDKIRQGKKSFTDDECEVTMVLAEVDHFEEIAASHPAAELIQQFESVQSVIDQLCDQYGLLKIEAVGKSYLACGGLKQAEKKIDQRLLNRHHSVRVTDFAVDLLAYTRGLQFKGGRQIAIKIAIHTGPVISSVLGETKPHFSLIGDSVKRLGQLVSQVAAKQIACTKQTNHYLELYTTNYYFQPSTLHLQDGSAEPVFLVSPSKVAKKLIADAVPQPPGAAPVGPRPTLPGKAPETGLPAVAGGKNLTNMKNLNLNESDSAGTEDSRREFDSHRGMLEQDAYMYGTQNIQQVGADADAESNRSDQIDDQTMNVFGFNDDLNLDDRIIIQNATENQLYNLVERPKYLLSFELKDAEQEFLYTISKQEARKTTIYLALLILLNKIVILGDMFEGGGGIHVTVQFYVMFPIFVFELVLIYKLNNPNYEEIYIWTYGLLVYGICVLGILLSYQAKYLGQWTITAFTELQIQLTISLIFMMRNVLLRHYLITYTVYMVTWIAAVSVIAVRLEYQIIQFWLGQVMYSVLLAVGIHHREMIQRKMINYERILNVQIDQTNALIGKLVPYHILALIKSERRQMVDEFSDCTLLFTDMGDFTEYQKNKRDPREVVQLLSKLFARFDQLCEEQRVYKVHTVGDCYVVMGYNGRVDKSKRGRAVVVDEASRVVQTGFEML
jgi:class 3 adenylate cyclase